MWNWHALQSLQKKSPFPGRLSRRCESNNLRHGSATDANTAPERGEVILALHATLDLATQLARWAGKPTYEVVQLYQCWVLIKHRTLRVSASELNGENCSNHRKAHAHVCSWALLKCSHGVRWRYVPRGLAASNAEGRVQWCRSRGKDGQRGGGARGHLRNLQLAAADGRATACHAWAPIWGNRTLCQGKVILIQKQMLSSQSPSYS